MDRRGLATGVLVSLPFTLSVALLCTTTGADAFYAPLAVATMLVGCGRSRASRGPT
jgi:hypothetical protein